jgi:RNA polymerase sigma-70 factor (ECF subfamily)
VNPTTDQQIRAWLAAGRPADAFDRLVSTYQHKLYRLALAILGEPGLAEDAAQEAFLRIWKSLGNFRGDSALSTWIYSIARNTALTLLENRRARAADSIEEPAVLRAMDNRLSGSVAPARAGFDVTALVAGLRPQYQQVLRLYYLEERSYLEVASMLDLPLGTVKTALHRAKLELAAALAAAHAPSPDPGVASATTMKGG